jgi:hypothetical protein
MLWLALRQSEAWPFVMIQRITGLEIHGMIKFKIHVVQLLQPKARLKKVKK